ncbi:MAG: hypothetical protein ACFFDN_10055 [Candidatus Hodarchaeota archaeon]
MIKEGILKGGKRKEASWNNIKFGEAFKKAVDRFREQVLPREDFDPTSLLQFGLFMSKALINVLKSVETKLGKEGQQAVIDGLIQTGYETAKEISDGIKIDPPGVSEIEFMSFWGSIFNIDVWSSIEDPKIIDNDTYAFDILWCPLQDIYSADDCRIQRYLVQGLIDYAVGKKPKSKKKKTKLKIPYFNRKSSKPPLQLKFIQSIPAGADKCKFIIERKKGSDWEEYSKKLADRALKRIQKE